MTRPLRPALRFAVGLALAASAASLAAQPPEPRDWGAALRADAQPLHDDIAANHPGPVNHEDPAFAARNDAQLALALERAKTAQNYADYYFALRIYVSSFDDGHMGFGAVGDPPSEARWPGFATRYDNSDAIVVATSEPGQQVPVGARLLGCDRMTSDAYAAATLGTVWGRWQLESQHQRRGGGLFIDEGDRYVPRAASCTFTWSGKRHTVALDWRPLPADRYAALVQPATARSQRAFAARTLANGIRWYAMPSFDGSPASSATAALPGMIAGIAAERAAIASAPAIVLDLRGNNGGSSDWSVQLARALWGQARIDALPQEETPVDWRASPANLAEIASGYDQRRGSPGFSSEADAWFRSIIAGLGAAIGRGDQLWREVDLAPPARPAPDQAPAPAAPARLAAPVYVLTDAGCASACLDALDLWTELGAIQVGRTTSADTLYMDVRRRTLPSGLVSVSVPMKVYRGRARGANQPAVPVHRFAGDIGDDAAVEQWIATLPAQRAH